MLSHQERRQEERTKIRLPCSARVNNRLLGLYWIEDLSTDGARLSHGLNLERDAQVGLTVHFPWAGSTALDAVVVHAADPPKRRAGAGVKFVGDSASRQYVKEALLRRQRGIRRRLPASALVVGESRPVRHNLIKDLTALGARVAVAESALEMTWQLGASGDRFDAVYLDHSLTGSRTLGWLRGLEESFPALRRVLLSEDPGVADLSQLLLSGRLHAVITTPWEKDYIAEVLGN